MKSMDKIDEIGSTEYIRDLIQRQNHENNKSLFDDNYTPEQINDYCEKVLNLHLSSRPEGKLLFESVQIIQQLQEELKGPVLLNPEVAIQIRGD